MLSEWMLYEGEEHTMPIFGQHHGRSQRWHHEVDIHFRETGEHPDLSKYDPRERPWCQMREATDRYLAKKKQSSVPGSQDVVLERLVLAHGRTDIAIIACGHVMSQQALRKFVEARIVDTIDSIEIMLRCVHAVSLINSIAVPIEDGLEALKLLGRGFLHRYSMHMQLLDLVLNFSRQSLAQSAIQRAFEKINNEIPPTLQSLREERQWSQAYDETRWLATFEKTCEQQPTNGKKLQSILDESIPFWRSWARWKPDVDRIKRWRHLSNEQRKKFGPILDLDGPDFELQGTTHGKSLANHRIPLRDRGKFALRINALTMTECLDMADRLIRLLDTTVTNRPDDIPLFCHALTNTDIMKRNLELMEALATGQYGTLNITIAESYSLLSATPEMQADAVKRTLRLMITDNFKGLRNAFAVDFAALMTDLIREERERLIKTIQSPRADQHLLTFDSYEKLHNDLSQAPWLWPPLYESLPRLMEAWPSTQDLKTLREIHLSLDLVDADYKSAVLEITRCYVLENPGSLNAGTRALMRSLIQVWQKLHDPTRKSIALAMIYGLGPHTEFRCMCLKQLPLLSDSFTQSLWTISCDFETYPDKACVSMAKIFADASRSISVVPWRPVLHRGMLNREDKLLEYVMEEMTFRRRTQFLEDLHQLYGTSSKWDTPDSPKVLKSGLLEWHHKLLPHASIIDGLIEEHNAIETVMCICFEPVGRPDVQQKIEQILVVLKHRRKDTKGGDASVRTSILNRLTKDGENAGEVCQALTALNNLSPAGFEVCTRVQHVLKTTSSEDASRTFMQAWLSDPSLELTDANALKIIFRSENPLATKIDPSVHDEGLALASKYMEIEYGNLLDEVRRLAALRCSLKVVDLSGITELLASIEIEDCTPAEDALASLPSELVNAMEVVGEKEVEILFPLTHLTQLQRIALGLGNAQSFVLFLEICDHKSTTGRFCIHPNTDRKVDSEGKTMDVLLNDIDRNVSPWLDTCHLGGKDEFRFCSRESSPFKSHLTKLLKRQLGVNGLGNGFSSLAEVHNLVTEYLKNIGRSCSICGQRYTVNLRRPTRCNSPSCITQFKETHRLIQLSDLVQDSQATDLLLSSIYAAASSGNLDLIPDCPIKDPDEIVSLLDKLPSTKSLSSSASTTTADGERWSKVAKTMPEASPNPFKFVVGEDIISYALNNHRSFLVSATSAMKVPSMPPGTLQFVLANSSPEREASFAAEVDVDPSDTSTQILFHGTSPDRLFAILCQGLKILSETPLQTHGAVNGRGIYMADEPSLSYLYCSKGLDKNWKNSSLDPEKNYKILLGCEQAGPRVIDGEDQIHLVKNEKTLILRYVFLIPGATETVPVARHLVPAMGSVCKSLRSGAL